MPTKHFLLTFDLTAGEVRELKEFADATLAAKAYVDAERANAGNRDLEIVLVGADSEETLHLTHGHYFGSSPDDVSGWLTEVG